MNSWFDCLLVLLLISIFNKGIAQFLSFTIHTALKTATYMYLKFRYIKLKNVKQKEEKTKQKKKKKNTDKIFEKVKPRYNSQN